MAISFLASTPLEVGLPASCWSTSATGRDSSYSAGSILFLNQSPIIALNLTTGTEFWFHWRIHYNNVGSGSSSGQAQVLRCLDTAGNLIFDLWKQGSSSYGLYTRLYGSSTVNGSTTWTPVTNTTYTMDLKLTVPASGGTLALDLYINGSLFSTSTATNSGTVKVRPRVVINDIANQLSSSSTGINLSEIIIAEGESTLNARLATFEPSSAGNFAQWTGSVAALADQDSASGVSVVSSAQRFNSVFSAYAGPATPASIRGVFLKAMGSQAGAVSPTQLNQSLRIGGTNYDGSAQAMVPGQGNIHEWANNPATSAPWLTAAFASLEGGLLSAA